MKMKLKVNHDYGADGIASIESNYSDLDGEFRDVYVRISGFFGPYRPELFAAAPDMYRVILQARRAITRSLVAGEDDDLRAAQAMLTEALEQAEGRR